HGFSQSASGFPSIGLRNLHLLAPQRRNASQRTTATTVPELSLLSPARRPALCGVACVAVGADALTVRRPWPRKRRNGEKIFALPATLPDNERTFPKGRETGVLSFRRSGVAAVWAVLEGRRGTRCPFP